MFSTYQHFLLSATVIFTLLYLVEPNEGILGESRWEKKSVDLEKHPHAKCLDGSPGAYWFAGGYGSGSHKFIIHHQVR